MSAQVQLGDTLARYAAGFNLLGRLTIMQHAQNRAHRHFKLATHTSLQQFAASTDDATMDVSFDLPATGAIDFLRDLTPVTKQVFDGLQRQYKRDAITLAGVSDQRVIAKVRDELAEVLQQGGTASDFRRAVNGITDDAGIARLTSFDIDTAFNTNVQKAFSVGRYEQMNEDSVLEALPFWQYWTVGDDRVRPAHRALDQFVAYAIDPVWRKIMPPCGFNCRCSVVPIMQQEALDIDPKARDDGYSRLPVIARLQIPQPGFKNIFGQAIN